MHQLAAVRENYCILPEWLRNLESRPDGKANCFREADGAIPYVASFLGRHSLCPAGHLGVTVTMVPEVTVEAAALLRSEYCHKLAFNLERAAAGH